MNKRDEQHKPLYGVSFSFSISWKRKQDPETNKHHKHAYKSQQQYSYYAMCSTTSSTNVMFTNKRTQTLEGTRIQDCHIDVNYTCNCWLHLFSCLYALKVQDSCPRHITQIFGLSYRLVYTCLTPRGVSRGNCAPVQTYDTQNVYYYYLRQEDYDYAADSSNILLELKSRRVSFFISQYQSSNR